MNKALADGNRKPPRPVLIAVLVGIEAAIIAIGDDVVTPVILWWLTLAQPTAISASATRYT
jgi:hypothetical protein